jgi:hypothetical protein
LGTAADSVKSTSIEVSWDPAARLATLHAAAGTTLGGGDAAMLIGALETWMATVEGPFGLLAHVQGVRGADAEYRARANAFFAHHRERAAIAVLGMGPVIRVIAEMFRIGTGVALKGFATEGEAREWLRGRGVGA